jgi:predicted O-methyltransferase YrrM/tetratricopeptide (TPR) repeat protein
MNLFKDVSVNNELFRVNPTEFTKVVNSEYNTLNILEGLGELERLQSLIKDLSSLIGSEKTIGFYGTSHGGYLPIQLSKIFDKVYVCDYSGKHVENVSYNITKLTLSNSIELGCVSSTVGILVTEDCDNINHVFDELPIIISPSQYKVGNDCSVYKITGTDLSLTIPNKYNKVFHDEFDYYITPEGELDYNNLVHLSMIVKNGGKELENMLTKNFKHIDRWTILDTGSTDNTVEIINRILVGKKKGELYHEPFVNFRESRNRVLDLTGTSCKFIITLDDTYLIEGDLKKFLNYVRGDQTASSFSLFIKSGDVEYTSNRIIKSEFGLRYIYTIHEVIQTDDNLNVGIPKNDVMIIDDKTDYMHNRTMNRKEFDLQLLADMVKEEPDNPRHLYYIAQTYNILDRRQEAYEYFMKRVNHPVLGYIQERVDSYFEAARNCHLHLNKPWEECEELYMKAFDLDPKRPDSLYFMAIHYLNDAKDEKRAYELFKQAFEVGYPLESQHSLKPTLSFHFLPRFLVGLCYNFEDYQLGQQVCSLYLNNNEKGAEQYEVMVSWYNIFVYLNRMPPLSKSPINPSKPYVCFVADGGFAPWTGSDITTKGVGGSETFIIELARYIQKSGEYNAIVFCNCPGSSVFEGVEYRHLNEFFSFMSNTRVHSCIVSRFTEYLPVAMRGYTDNVYLILHDLSGSGVVIPKTQKLKKVFCLTEWHVEYFTQMFPSLKDITEPFNYGIDFNLFLPPTELQTGPKGNYRDNKIPYRFIYSSFPNRGLLPLLQMWPRIVEKNPEASLHIHSDVNGKWVNEVYPEGMAEIKKLLSEYNDIARIKRTLHYHGWTSKKDLAESWLMSDIWFYPCIFQETFCLTALEAALTKTFAVTSNLAALQNTVGDRGFRIIGDPMSKEWQDKAIEILFSNVVINTMKDSLVKKNYDWAIGMSWENRAKYFITQYLDKSRQFAGMYNWTNDLPHGHKQIFNDVLTYFNSKNIEKPRILEIGTYAGTSLIEILEKIPRSTGVAIDMWKNYDEKNVDMLKNIEENHIENVFLTNIRKSGMNNRVSAYKGNSLNVLMMLLKGGKEMFDFIYVDGSHKCLDCYSDLILSWELLNPGGILAIDDYLFTAPTTLDCPMEAVDRFLQLYSGKYKLISKTYRVFIEKN